MSGVWVRATRAKPCAICGHAAWCASSADGALGVCMRESRGAFRSGKNGGWLHWLRQPASWCPIRRGVSFEIRSAPDWTALAARAAERTGSARIDELARELVVQPKALHNLGTFWSDRHRAFGFPMTDHRRRVVGIRLRALEGAKWSVRGGREGVFMPHDIAGERADGIKAALGISYADPLVLPEGPTSCAAVLSVGLRSIGRPNNMNGASILAQLVRGRHVVVLGENDRKVSGLWPGRDGARHLALALVAHCASVRIAFPPAGIKDVRDWLRAGATRSDFLAAFDKSEPLRLRLVADLP